MSGHITDPAQARKNTPSPLPPHIRPHASRTSSSSSTHSNRHPHAQQREYVPSSLDTGLATEAGPSGLGERWAYEHAEHPHSHHHPDVEGDDDEDESESEGGSEADWIAAKEQSDARRPAWRRASPRWLYPFVSGATLALGMGIAPRSEIYVNLACLAHPPQTQGSASLSGPSSAGIVGMASEKGRTEEVGQGWGLYSFHSLHTASLAANLVDINIGNITDGVSLPAYPEDLSPADRWFYKIQKDIYDYELLKRTRRRGSGASTTIGKLPGPTDVPSPQPTGGPGHGHGHGHETDGSDGSGEEEPDEPRPPYKEIDPRACKRDKVVQAAAAKLVMTMTLALGIISALTTGYWGQMSDKIGRTKIMGVLMTGLLINEICFTLVATFPHLAPGGYKALLIGPTFEGLLGGISTLTATINAYVSDVTPDGSRASIFARMGGIFMLGFACGPALGSVVIKATGNIMTPFYINIFILAFYVLFIFFVLPESLSKEARTILRKNAQSASEAQARQDVLAREWENETPALGPNGGEHADPFLSATPDAGASRWSRRFSVGGQGQTKRSKRIHGFLRRAFRKATAFLQPLAVFMPSEKEGGGRDWNMTVTGAALFMMSLMMGVYQVKAQFTLYTFGWTSAQLGPFMSLLGFSRGFVMLAILPLAMRLAKRIFFPAPPPADPSSSTFSGISAASSHTVRPNSTSESTPLLPATPVKVRRPATLDLWTARLSLAWEALMYFILAFNLPALPFIAISALVTLSAGSNPAANSLALSFIPNSREAGKLFGGVAVLHALGSTLLGPLAFGSLFSATVGDFTPAVWVLAGVVQATSLGFMCFVRIPRGREEGEEAGRGRVRRVKSGGMRK